MERPDGLEEWASPGSPLIEAARDGDLASVELYLAAGLGRSPGSAWHAAYEELPELALRLLRANTDDLSAIRFPPAERSPDVPADAVWVAGLDAFVVGDLDGRTGAAVGTWRLWEDGSRYSEADFVGGDMLVHRQYVGPHLREEQRWRPDGALASRRQYDAEGRVETAVLWQEDGTVVRQWFAEDETLTRERAERADAFAFEYWYDETGARVAEVVPSAGPFERWRGFDAAGAIIVEGDLEPGEFGRPIGAWDLYGADGTHLGRESFAEFALTRNPYLGRYAHALHAWRTAPIPDELAGAEAIDWSDLATLDAGGRHIPFLLRGLARPDAWAFDLALGQLRVLLGQEGEVVEATGPALRFLAALVDRVVSADARVELLAFLARIATGNGGLGLVSDVLAALPADGVDAPAHLAAANVDPDYAEVYAALAETVPTWARLAADPDPDVRRWGVVLLAAAPGPHAVRTLHDRLAVEPERWIRAEILLALAARDPGDAAAVEPFLADDDPLLRCCAALTWIRHRWLPDDEAVRALVDAPDLSGYGRLFYGSGDPRVDLLDLVFPTAYQPGEPLTEVQRAVIRTIADHDDAWLVDVDVAEALRFNGLPPDADALRALAGTASALS
ncbi:hypothetical protein [Cryptosporangium aurantiacum]|uniref:HEAT repeat n=1 Tax=Cryptosporangium aurantiacum TaxID=134849 RepID=A0A1M7RGL6_9ACTN|nr:hypothetical protein [Cryptosporangium aurantiacum]SHN45188.1 HEAT repeat [Cryptosporangium aurantiacum]